MSFKCRWKARVEQRGGFFLELKGNNSCEGYIPSKGNFLTAAWVLVWKSHVLLWFIHLNCHNTNIFCQQTRKSRKKTQKERKQWWKKCWLLTFFYCVESHPESIHHHLALDCHTEYKLNKPPYIMRANPFLYLLKTVYASILYTFIIARTHK